MTQSQGPGQEDWGGPTPWQQPPRPPQQPLWHGSDAALGPVGPPPGPYEGYPPGKGGTAQGARQQAPTAAPPTYLVQAILVTVFCFFFPFAGVVALVFAARTSQKIAAGDLLAAQKASRRARLWAIIGLVVGCVLWLLYLVGLATSTADY